MLSIQDRRRQKRNKCSAPLLLVLVLLCLVFSSFLLLPSKVQQERGRAGRANKNNSQFSSSEILALAKNAPKPQDPSLFEIYEWLDNLPGPIEADPIPSETGETLLHNTELCTFSENTEVVAAIREGMSHLHSFWPFEAMRAFRRAIRLEGECCSIYWGLISALEYNKGFKNAQNELIEIAEEYCSIGRATAFNRLYFEAFSNQNSTQRIEKFRRITSQSKDELEARLWVGIELIWKSSRSMFEPEPIERFQGMQFLEVVLQNSPHNPAANHYWIHGWEDTLYPEVALPHAKILPVYAARSPHLVHMPGHVYHRLGNYNTAANEFRDASYVDIDYMRSQGITGRYHWQYTHNLAYLADMLACSGRIQEAIEVSKQAISPQNLKILDSDFLFPLTCDPSQSTSVAHFFYQGARSVGYIHMRYGNWKIAADELQIVIDELSKRKDKEELWVGLLYLSTLQFYCELRYQFSTENQCEGTDDLLQYFSYLIDKLEEYSNINYLEYNIQALKVMQLELDSVVQGYCIGDMDSAHQKINLAADLERSLPYSEPPAIPYPTLQTKGDLFVLQFQRTKEYSALHDAIYCNMEILNTHPNYPFSLFNIAVYWKQINSLEAATEAFEYFGKFLDVWPQAEPSEMLSIASQYAVKSVD